MVATERKDASAVATAADVKLPVHEAPRFSVKYIDASVNPRQDFFAFGTGGWEKANPIPKDKVEWGAMYETYEWNLVLLHKIAEECANEVRLGALHLRDGEGPLAPAQGSYRRLVGDFYASAMDTARIENLKFAPIEDLLQNISAAKSTSDIVQLMPVLFKSGVRVFFDSDPGADMKDSSIYSLYFAQGGISLPDREYYISENFTDQLENYRKHVAKMFALYGMPELQAQKWADTVVSIETELAKASRSRADLRDPEKNYNRIETSKLDTTYGSVGLTRFMKDVGVPEVPYVVIQQPEFFDALNSLLSKRDPEELKVYMRWRVLNEFASALHREVDEEDFDFFRRKLNGQEEQKPRWKRALGTIDESVGDALSKLYVEGHFDTRSVNEAREMTSDIVAAFRDRLEKLPWMSDETRKQALDKLDNMGMKIGYPAKFRQYAGLTTDASDYVGNLRRASAAEVSRMMPRVGGPFDRSEWPFTAITVNAAYMQENNEIVISASQLQPPFFDAKMDIAVNYGAIGAVIGHEITHGFDDEGRKFDTKGNLRDWWTPEDEKRFNALAESIVKAYGSIEVLPGFKINGQLTLGENIADIGGLIIAYDALEKRLARDPSLRVNIDGFTPEQRFFISYAQSWRGSTREDALRESLTDDEHAPFKYRVNVPVANLAVFDAAFPPKTDAERAEAAKPKAEVW